MVFTILISCLFLFYLDYETTSVAMLFSLEMLVPLVLYFTPTFLVCYLLFRWLRRKNSANDSLAIALIAGIPSAIALVIVVLNYSLHRH